MALTDKQKIERKRFIGSSDIAALFTDENNRSLDPFKNATDIYTLKVFEFEESKSTKSQSMGHRYESALIAFAENELGCKIESNPDKMRFICEKHPIFACNLDGFTLNGKPEIVEVKTTGMVNEWGEPGTDDVPFRVILQVQQQFLCTGAIKAHIAILLGRWGLTEEMYCVDRNETIIETIIERGEQFWNDYVLTKTPPPDSEPGNLQLFKRICRIPASYAEIDPIFLTTWETLKETRLNAKKREDEALAEILKSIGDAEAAKIGDNREFTYFLQNGAAKIDRQMLKNDFPEVYEKVTSENHYRVPKIRKI